MFRKLVSNLPFSPALVGQLGFYAKRLKKEEATRRLGLVFTILALIVQSFAVINPPESANASSAADFIYGGVKTKQQLLDVYDRSARGSGDFKYLVDYAGITRSELEKAKEATISSLQHGKDSGTWQNWTRSHRYSSSEGEVKHTAPRPNGVVSTIYTYPLWRHDSTQYEKKYGSTYQAFVGYSAKIGAFAIIKDCGNIITRVIPTPVPEAAFVEATCETIRGYAFDSRNKSIPVAVHLYFNGPPGKGEKVGPITADGKNNSFTSSVPQKYRSSRSSTTVWAVMVPLSGWNQSTIQFKNTVQIPGNCAMPIATPAASCVALKPALIERTKFSLNTSASVENGATISGYTYVVKDADGNTVYEKEIASGNVSSATDSFDLYKTGTYTANVVVNTSLGARTSADCSTVLSVVSTSTCLYNSDLSQSNEDCRPCPADSSLWLKDPACNGTVVESKLARNLTQNTEASSTVADGGDRIQYTLYVENIGNAPTNVAITEELSDVMEYATILDNGGGSYNRDSQVLSWSSLTLQPGERQSRSFVVTVMNDIPATPQGTSNPSSYNCLMTNAFGTTVEIKVNCPQVKMMEQTVKELPSTGAGANFLFAGVLMATVTFFWARSRQLNKEIRLIRKDFNMGTL